MNKIKIIELLIFGLIGGISAYLSSNFELGIRGTVFFTAIFITIFGLIKTLLKPYVARFLS